MTAGLVADTGSKVSRCSNKNQTARAGMYIVQWDTAVASTYKAREEFPPSRGVYASNR